jgi:LmbE family N-acetylglucosaminyl deacetylase
MSGREFVALKTVIFVGAHPDDIELGCAGTVKMFIDRGYSVKCVYVTRGGHTSAPDEREKESREALKILGVEDRNISFGDFTDTEIPGDTRTIKFLQTSHLLRSNGVDIVDPDLDVFAAFVHTEHDSHPDHRAVSTCCLTAFRRVPRIYAYESPSSTGSFNPRAFVDISGAIEEKKDALACHRSQLALGDRYYLEYNAMSSLARFRGRQGGYQFAEGFEIWKECIDPAVIYKPGLTLPQTAHAVQAETEEPKVIVAGRGPGKAKAAKRPRLKPRQAS